MNGLAYGLDMDARRRKEHAFATAEGYGDSWWLGLDRVAFYERARLEQERIKRSRFGRTDMVTTARNVSAATKHESILGEEE